MEFTKQGSTLAVRIKLKLDNTQIFLDLIDSVEFVFGKVKKIYPKDVKTIGNDFVVSFTQEDTIKMPEIISYQARVKFKDGQVKGTEIYTGRLNFTMSREIL